MISVTEATQAFMAEQATQGLSPRTTYGQGLLIKRFDKVCSQAARERGRRSPFKVKDIDPAVISAYFATAAGQSQGNRNMLVNALRKFLRWCERCRYLAPGDAERLMYDHKIKATVRNPKYYVPVEDFPDLLDAQTRHPSDRMVMALVIYTLIRSSEVKGLRLQDIDLPAAMLSVYRVKRRRWTDIRICPELMDELVAYLEFYAAELHYGSAAHLIETQPDWLLIPRLEPVWNRNTAGKGYITSVERYEMDPMASPSHLENVVKRGLDVTGAKTSDGKAVNHLGEGMHTVRRSGARAMLDHLTEDLGADRAILQVATMLDHEDTQQTLLYIGRDQERDKLNDFLRSSSPYGTAPKRRHLRSVG